MNDVWNLADWERIWFRTQSRQWRTLAVVPTEIETTDSAFDMAKFIVGLGAQHDEKLGFADFRNIPLYRVSAFLQLADGHVNEGERLVYATRSIAENPATVPVARSSDCVLLCVSLGKTSIRAIEDAIDQIGRERFLGSVVFRQPATKPSQQTGLVLRRETIEVRG